MNRLFDCNTAISLIIGRLAVVFNAFFHSQFIQMLMKSMGQKLDVEVEIPAVQSDNVLCNDY